MFDPREWLHLTVCTASLTAASPARKPAFNVIPVPIGQQSMSQLPVPDPNDCGELAARIGAALSSSTRSPAHPSNATTWWRFGDTTPNRYM